MKSKVQELAQYVVKVSFEDLSEAARRALKIRVLDSLGCAIGALEGEPIRLLRAQLDDFGGAPHCTLVGGGQTALDRAAFYNSALVRYLDFNDSYLAKGESCHPSDNLGPVLAAEYAGIDGRDFMVALAVAYQVQCRLSDVAPVRHKGFDHTTQGAYAVAAGVAKALGLDAERTANAVAISGTAFNALRVTRTGRLSHWKGLAYPNTQFGAGGATTAAELATEGTRPPEWVIARGKRFLEAGAYLLMIESEGITESVKTWRTDIVSKIADGLGLEKVMFEAAEPEVFEWYVKNYGPEVNLFVDHSQIVQLETLRRGIWGTKSLWGRVLTYKD